jgi:large subunit ribosomal protein L4
MQLGALQAALKQQIATNSLIVVDRLAIEEAKTKVAAEWLKRLNAIESTLLVDVEFEASLVLAVRNLPGVDVRRVIELTARDVLGARQVIATRSAIERLQKVLGR